MVIAHREISIIRIIAAVVSVFGLILMGNEILEQIVSCQIGACEQIHLRPFWLGMPCTILGCLILQKGDVSTSLLEITTAYERIRYGSKGRRDYDNKPVLKP